ncbi:MAG: hypothetical protein JXQ87_12685 [Bacteroidia bacterium]
MKKEIIVSVLLFVLVLAGSVTYFTKYIDGQVNISLAQAIPEESILVFDLEPCVSADSIQNQFLANFMNDTLFGELISEFESLTKSDSILNCSWYSSGFAALTRVNHKKTGWLFAFDGIDKEKGLSKFGDEIVFEKEFGEVSIGSKTYFFEVVDDILLFTSHKVVLDASKESLKTNSNSFISQKWQQAKGDILINYELSTWLLSNLFEETNDELNEILAPFKGVGHYEISLNEQEMNLFGSLGSSHQNSAFNNDLYGKPSNLTSLEILPANTSFFWSEVAFDFEAQIRRASLDEAFKNELDSFQKKNSLDLITDLCVNVLDEYVVGALNAYNHKLDNSFFVAIKVKDEQSLTLALDQLDSTKTSFLSKDSLLIRRLNSGKLLNYLIGGAVPDFKSPYYSFTNGFVVFSDNISHLNQIHESIKVNSTLSNSLTYGQAADWTNKKCNLVLYVNPRKSYNIPKDILSEKAKTFYFRKIADLEGIDHFVYQMVKSEKDFFNHIYIKSSEKKSADKNDVLFTKNIGAKIVAGPFLVTNYHTTKKEIMVVDENGKAHQINSSNETVWTYVLNGNVTSKPIEVDALQNNKLQYLIATDAELYLIDRKGRDVGAFPLTYPVKANSRVSVFENESNYSVYVPCKKGRVYGYNIKGNPLASWAPMNLSSNGRGSMQYFTKSGKRYRFIATESGSIYIWDDNNKMTPEVIETKTRLTSDFTLMFGKELRDCKLLAIDSAGNYIKARLDGTVSKRKLPTGFESPSGFWWQFDGKGGKELVLWSKNKMAVLDQGLTEQYKISTTNAIEHVEVLNMPNGEEIFAVQTMNKQLYLYTFEGELLNFEPFDSNSRNSVIVDLDKDEKADLVVGLDDKLIVYKNIK